MILVDTSVWVDHLRAGDEELVRLLTGLSVLVHPFVVGELACGNIHNRAEVLKLLSDLPSAISATDSEALFYIEQHQLMGRGIGYIDAHLLAAVSLTSPALLWTRDRRLARIAHELGLAYRSVATS